MKKWYVIVVVFLSVMFNAQCNISGKTTLNVGEKSDYFVANELAQCKECHQWRQVGNNASVEGDIRLNKITLNPTGAGRVVLSVTYMSPKGVELCSKNIDIIAPETESNNKATAPEEKINCNVKVTNFKEVKLGDGLVGFFPIGNTGDFNYEWTVTYSDGSVQTSKNQAPQFNYNFDTTISKVNLRVASKICYKNLSKTYQTVYWKALN